ncbi:Hypothetical protein CINCED_3A018105 [Cinara cedri]|uniref:Uncharacterized protein n=1 Tax=Cinara cedri TaxID=506608 RepID=A0A5E4NPQ7_9HEMI|nr:Hypothetical protein CINCED_3A018105 [Cinara cedri]
MAAKRRDVIPGTPPTAMVLTAVAALCSCGPTAAAAGRNDIPQTFAEASRAARPTDAFLAAAPPDAFLTAGPGVAAYGPSLADMSQFVEAVESRTRYPLPAGSGVVGAWTEQVSRALSTLQMTAVQGRGKKPKPGQMAMAMIGSAIVSMMTVKTLAAIKLFIIYTLFATKVGLLIGVYLLASKMLEIKHTSAKKVVKWEPPPLQPPVMFVSVAADQQHPADESSYENHLLHNHLQPPPPGQPNLFQYQHHDQYQVQDPYSDQYQHQNQQQPFLPPDKLPGEDEDLLAHYSHIRPVTYRPKIDRNQLNDLVKSGIGGQV